jgi:two-component system, LytTR family, sensor kinase
MYKKQLFKTALISSPLMAAFEISPVFFLYKQEDYKFLQGMIAMTLISFIIWMINIVILNYSESRQLKPMRKYILSYLCTIIFVLITFIIIKYFSVQKPDHAPSVFLPIINILALNTIILLLSNAIVMRFKKVRAENELADLKIKHLEAEYQQLLQQLQPHFLFNSLSTLKSLIKKDSGLAEEYLVKLSDFLRFTLSANDNSVISLAEEVKFTSDYIDLQKIRFADSFFCRISIPENIQGDYKIPVYALQTLVENAIKHNAFTETHPLHLSIEFQDGFLVVTNNKIPKPGPANSNGVGLKNLGKRYALMTENAVTIEETADQYSVKIKLLA